MQIIKKILLTILKIQIILILSLSKILTKKLKKKLYITYPKKIYCKYVGSNNKILVSNGKSLAIKTKVGYYLYPLKKTPLNYILDKNFLINKIYNLEENSVDKFFISYLIMENDNEFNIFFDSKTFNLIGWQIKDIYQNLNITYLSSIRKNETINEDLFKIPSRN